MTYHADPLHSIYDLTQRCCTFLQGRIRNFITKNCTFLIETPDRNSISEFAVEVENHSILMAHTNPIDISSSDSEAEIESVVENGLSMMSTMPRKLPSWATNATTKPNGHNGSSQNQQFLASASASAGRLTNPNNLVEAKFHKHPSSTYSDVSANHHKSLTDDLHLTTVKRNADRPLNGLHIGDLDSSVSGRYTNMYPNDNEKNTSQQSLRRSLPPSFQASASTGKAKAFMENGGRIGISDTHSKPYKSLGKNTMDHKICMTGNFGREDSDDITIYEHGRRLLPPSMMHGKHLPSSQSAGPSDSAYHTGVEEGPTETDERLVYQAALENLAQPKLEATLPDGLLAVPLLRHQKIALAWMYKKETASLHCLGGILADDQGLGKTVSTIALILLQKHIQSKSTTDDVHVIKADKAEALNLDDDDDDGISEVERVKQNEESDEVKTIPKARGSVPAFHKGRPAAGTLVVCPASVLRQWDRELHEKVVRKLSVLIYHGGTRTKDPVELAKYDVVLTTYAIIANEVPKQPLVADDDEDQDDGDKYGLCSEFSNNKKRKKASNANKKGKKGRKGIDSSIDCSSGTLAKVGWFRVILDEAQTIKNHKTQVARACCGLRAKRRWCLSGTPIQNTIDDLFSYFRFLKYDPYSVYRSFCSSIKYPISRNASHGYKKLQAVLKTIMLRRTKGMQIDGKPIIDLPPKSICLTNVNFSVEERDFYSKLEADSRSQFKAYAAAGTVNQNYANILLMLLRLRQACDHPLLVKGHSSDFVGKASVEMARSLPKDLLINLVNLLEDPICSICRDPPEQAVVTMCGHVFCYQCVSEYLTGEDNSCPAHGCRELLGPDVVFAKATLWNCISGDSDDRPTSLFEGAGKSLSLENMYTSSKIRAALEILEKHCKPKDLYNDRLALEGCNGNSSSSEAKYLESSSSDVCVATNSTQTEGPTKAIVFSQWTGMLDLVETSLNHSCIQYRRFDGTMTLAARDRAVKDFNNDPEVTVILMSLKAGNLGLNLVAASHVILLDLWWNPTTEDQAIDRAHRIGQTRPVTVSRLTVTGTIEDRILALQEEKRKMVASAFGEEYGGSATRLTVDDLRYLFMV